MAMRDSKEIRVIIFMLVKQQWEEFLLVLWLMDLKELNQIYPMFLQSTFHTPTDPSRISITPNKGLLSELTKAFIMKGNRLGGATKTQNTNSTGRLEKIQV